MAKVNANEVIWEEVEVLDKKGLFACCRINKETVPEGYYVYDIRHDDDCQGDPVQIARWAMVNHWGTLLVKEPFELEQSPHIDNAYLDIEPEEDWNYLGICYRFNENGQLIPAY